MLNTMIKISQLFTNSSLLSQKKMMLGKSLRLYRCRPNRLKLERVAVGAFLKSNGQRTKKGVTIVTFVHFHLMITSS